MNSNLIIDFDSTINKLEALDELAKIVDKRNQTSEVSEKIKTITELGMLGQISFAESLKNRMELLDFSKRELDSLVRILKANFSDSFIKNVNYLESIANHVIIISGGFKDFIVPALSEFKLLPSNIYANEFIFNGEGRCIGIDQENPLSRDNGKPNIVNKLGLYGEIIVIGDGYTDYQIKEQGAAHKFIAFTENISRTNVIEKADFIANNFDDVIKYLN